MWVRLIEGASLSLRLNPGLAAEQLQDGGTAQCVHQPGGLVVRGGNGERSAISSTRASNLRSHFGALSVHIEAIFCHSRATCTVGTGRALVMANRRVLDTKRISLFRLPQDRLSTRNEPGADGDWDVACPDQAQALTIASLIWKFGSTAFAGWTVATLRPAGRLREAMICGIRVAMRTSLEGMACTCFRILKREGRPCRGQHGNGWLPSTTYISINVACLP